MSNAFSQFHFIRSNSTMSMKSKKLFVICIICAHLLDVAVGIPAFADVNKDTVRDRRQLGCSSGGCHKGYCWAGCVAALAFVTFGN